MRESESQREIESEREFDINLYIYVFSGKVSGLFLTVPTPKNRFP